MPYRVTKHYGHEQGLSACFRQWRADSHCALLHGYALAFTFVFEADDLDHRGWVVDFGNLDALKAELKRMFDHKLLVAGDDPDLEQLKALFDSNLAEGYVFPDGVGCEKFAKYAFGVAREVLKGLGEYPRVRVISCEVREHGANSAIYIGDK
jgi:6-pyruvoyltetrahydropterin/6-carboxytetrahydropterin synthase